jgi:hypothetical protein
MTWEGVQPVPAGIGTQNRTASEWTSQKSAGSQILPESLPESGMSACAFLDIGPE